MSLGVMREFLAISFKCSFARDPMTNASINGYGSGVDHWDADDSTRDVIKREREKNVMFKQ